MIYSKAELSNSFFFRIGTKLRKPHEKLSPALREAWSNKYAELNTGKRTTELQEIERYNEIAHTFPEFGEIESVSYGLFEIVDKKEVIEVDSVTGKTEKDVLDGFSQILGKVVSMTLAGYNIVNHDIPYIVKRMIVNRVPLPFLLQLRGKKPWEISVHDVMRDYQGTVYEHTPLNITAEIFEVKLDKSSNAKERSASEVKAAIEIAVKMS